MVILDIREKEEFESEHIPGSICCPMSQLDTLAPGILKNIEDKEIVVMCRSGNRARLAVHELKKTGLKHNFTVYEGGIIKWRAEKKEVTGNKAGFPILRQVQIFASTMIFLAFFGSFYIHQSFIYLALFVGFGLGLSGWTGVCPAAFIIQKMPWNNKKADECSSDKSCCF